MSFPNGTPRLYAVPDDRCISDTAAARLTADQLRAEQDQQGPHGGPAPWMAKTVAFGPGANVDSPLVSEPARLTAADLAAEKTAQNDFLAPHS